jgi:hypothetical protein
MHYSEILNDPAVLAALKASAPASKFSGNPLSITHGLADQQNPRSVRLTWENCRDSADWWHGADEINYTRQIRQPVTAEEIEQAAIAAGLDPDEVIMAMMNYRIEADAAKRQGDEYLATLDREAEERRLAKVAAYEQASPDEKRAMLYDYYTRGLHGRRARNRRKTVRDRLAKQTPPATFHF